MKKAADRPVRATPRSWRRALLVALFAAAAASAWANLFVPARPLRRTSTRYFDIVYPEDLGAQARALAAYADDVYGEVAAFFGAERRLRFPVVLTPDFESANGYFTVWPHRHIVLCVAPTDPDEELGFLADDLESVFRHELAHAVSLTMRPSFWNALAAVFGDPAGLSYYTTPASLSEGGAIALEGMNGYGRAADPLTRSGVAQDALEGRFLSFWEAAGAWDRYPYGRVPYSYGALFTEYLREKYGDDSYRELWRRMGKGLLFPGLGDFLSIKGVFHKVYGVPLKDAWRDFEAYMVPDVRTLGAERMTEPGCLAAVTGSGNVVYYADEAARSIRSVDAATGRPLRSYPGDSSVGRLDASPDGGRLLVSSLRYEKNLPVLRLRELDLATGRSRPLPYRGLRDACYAAGGLAAIRAEPSGASLVLVRGGREELLLPGNPSISYASPCPSPDGGWLYALRREDGLVSVVRARIPEPGAPAEGAVAERLVLPERFRSIRYLSVDARGVLRFSWDDGSFYRLAEFSGGRCAFQAVPLSGGVRNPVSVSGRVFYLGSFSEGVALCSFPAAASDLGILEEPVRWEPLGTVLPGEDGEEDENARMESRRYSALPWLAPRFWYPSFSASSDGLWSAGATAVSQDPAENFTLVAQAQWVPSLSAANLLAVLEVSAFPSAFSFMVSDDFVPDGADALRTTCAEFSAERVFSFYNGRSLEMGAGLGVEGFARVSPEKPYRPYDDVLAFGTASIGGSRWAYDVGKPAAQKGARIGLTGFAARVLPPDDPESVAGLEAALELRALPAALALNLYGALSLSPGLSYGPDGRSFFGFSSRASYPEYASFAGGDPGKWYAYAEASAAPAVLEVQGRLGPIHLQRFVLRAGLRGAAADGELLYSGYSRLSAAFAPLVGVLARSRPEAWMEAGYAPEPGRWTLRWSVEIAL